MECSSPALMIGRCCPMRPISHQPAPFVLVLACVVLKPTPPPSTSTPPRLQQGHASLCKVGETLQKVWGDFRHKPSSRRVCAAPGPSTRPRPWGWESPSLELASVCHGHGRAASLTRSCWFYTLIQICSRLSAQRRFPPHENRSSGFPALVHSSFCLRGMQLGASYIMKAESGC